MAPIRFLKSPCGNMVGHPVETPLTGGSFLHVLGLERIEVLTSIVVSIVRSCTRFAGLSLFVGLALAVGAGVYTAHHFKINTDINTLISASLDWRQRDQVFEQAFDRDRTILA